jgi:D-alanyl-D-alanine carboxypeptidase (penicillin-binding protein 5/6)
MSEETSSKHKGLGTLILAVIFLAIIISIIMVPNTTASLRENEASVIESFTFSHSAFEKAVLQAEVAYIENLETGEALYQNNAHIVSPLASLTKIMTTYTALSVFPEGARITIEESDLEAEGDHGLVPGEEWSVRDLLTFMLIASANDAALAIERAGSKYTGELTFAEYMTKQAHELGFDSLSFQNASGLDLDEAGTLPSALGNAEDLTKLFSLVYKQYPDIFDATKKQVVTFSSSEREHTAQNTNTELHRMPGVIGSKTGYTNTAGGNLSVIAEVNGIPHVVTVLQSTRGGRFEDVEEIIGLIGEENND